jgi:hypothetical protein
MNSGRTGRLVPDDAGKGGRAERLQEEIGAPMAQGAAQQCAGTGADKY